jgi:ribonuclease HI
MDGSKLAGGVGSVIVIFENNQLSIQMTYKLADEYSNNQAEQLAIVNALEKLRKDFKHLQGPQLYTRTVILP